MKKPHKYTMLSLPTVTILLLTMFLASNTVSADDSASVVDEINITVPISCTISGTGMNTHNATINNGQYNSAIGETTMKAFCNDAEGFAIYAIGYTDNTDGKNVLTNSELGSTYDIETGTSTSGSDSQWAMKLSTITSPEPTYPIQIQNNFTSFQEVPDDYTLVAKRNAGTDIGQSAEGSTLKSTYQAYISSTQAAGTYTGQVKYILVHPNYVDKSAIQNAITVVFDGNGLTFPDSSTTNTVKYANVCKPGEYAYVGNDYQEVMTSNILPGGEQDGSYTDSESILRTITLPNADKIKVEIDYGITYDTMGIEIVGGNWDGDWDNYNSDWQSYEIYDSNNNTTGSKTFVIDGDTVTLRAESWGASELNYDKGFYARIYPVYDSEQPDTTGETLPGDCAYQSISGTYTETTTWNDKWITFYEICNRICETIREELYSEEDLIWFIEYRLANSTILPGSMIDVSAHNPYTLKYNGNGATSEFGMGAHRRYSTTTGIDKKEEVEIGSVITLFAPNYKRPSYGFIGWSAESNAANQLGTAKVYGPNETITVDEALLNTANSQREITMYAIWLPSSGNIQDWTGCDDLSINESVALTDVRDNETYAVAKLADGNCWMLENLRLGGDDPITLTAADTQSAGILPAAFPDKEAEHNWGNSYEYQGVSAINTAYPVNNVQYITERSYAYGNYYSWAAAINSTDYITSNTPVDTSICPHGWTLPSSSSFQSLINANVDTDLTNHPNNYVLSAGNQNYEARHTGDYGFYWSSTTVRNSGSDAEYLEVWRMSQRLETDNRTHKSEGYAIRCLFDQ